ncbi:hypothetical protein NHF45_06915 [Maricaulaceae bacterium NA33B04]|nr:hypothetical protein [Maricaulaceae bacterium NA33B04]
MLDMGQAPFVEIDTAQEVRLIRGATRVGAFDLQPGAAVPETDTRPVLVIAETPVALRISGAGLSAPVALAAGQSLFLAEGLAGIENVGDERAGFYVIGLAPGRRLPSSQPALHRTGAAND